MNLIDLIAEIILVIAVIILIGIVILSFSPNTYRKIKIPKTIPSNGFKFRIMQTATTLTHDGLFPSVTLFQNYLKYRLVCGHKIEYKEIIEIDAKKYLLYGPTIIVKTKKKGFFWKNAWLCVGREDNALELLNFFKNKNFILSERARKILATKSFKEKSIVFPNPN